MSRESAGEISRRFALFNTNNEITLYECGVPSGCSVEALLDSLYDDCRRFHALWNFTDPASDIARINAAESCVTVDPVTADMLARSLALFKGEPRLNICCGALSYLWKQCAHAPSEAQVAEALRHVSCDALEVAADACQVRKSDQALKVDIGAVAKGYIADYLADKVRAWGVSSAKIYLGGQTYCVGDHPQGGAWPVDLLDFAGCDMPRIGLRDTCMSVSSDRFRARTVDGARCSHIIDVSTGRPCRPAARAAAVICKDALLCDGLSTVAYLEGPGAVARLARAYPQADFLVVDHEGAVYSSLF